MAIGSLLTSADPVLSQVISKEPAADKYAQCALKEIISIEAGSKEGFEFPFFL